MRWMCMYVFVCAVFHFVLFSLSLSLSVYKKSLNLCQIYLFVMLFIWEGSNYPLDGGGCG